MKSRRIYSSLALAALSIAGAHASTLFIPVMTPVLSSTSSAPAMTPVFPTTQQGTVPVVPDQQPAFTNTGTPTYPILGNTTAYMPTVPVAQTMPQPQATTTTINQQIVSNYNNSLQTQTDNLYNPTSYGAYGSSYGYNNTTTNYGFNSAPAVTVAMMPYVNGVSTALWQQVVQITNNNPSVIATPGLFDPASTAPEPGTLLLLIAGLGTLGVVARRQQKKKA